MNIVLLARMSADHVRRYSTDRKFSGNSVDPDKILHYAQSDLGGHSFPGYPYRDTRKQWVMTDNKTYIHVGRGKMIYKKKN